MRHMTSKAANPSALDRCADSAGLTILPGRPLPDWAQVMLPGQTPDPILDAIDPHADTSHDVSAEASDGGVDMSRDVDAWAADGGADASRDVDAWAADGGADASRDVDAWAADGAPEFPEAPLWTPYEAPEPHDARPEADGKDGTFEPAATDGEPAATPHLTPEQVFVLAQLAEMITAAAIPGLPAAGGIPPETAGGTGAEECDLAPWPAEEPEVVAANRSGRRLVALAAGAAVITAAGLGIAYRMVGSDAPPQVPATDLTMPAAVSDLVPIASSDASQAIQPLIGYGLRPAGITITGAYGSDVTGPVTLATMATTLPATKDVAEEIASWTDRTGAVVKEPVTGTGAMSGITCVAVPEHPEAPIGSFCVWTGTGERGQSYVVDAAPREALAQTADFRAALDAAQA